VDLKVIDREAWGLYRPSDDSEVLIAVVAKGGNFRETFRMIALVVAVAALAYASPALGISSPFWSTLFVASGTVAASWALSKLLPAIIPQQSFSGLNTSEDSQMYAISNQGNNVKKYGMVPQVYGEHRIFPNVVAAPYTALASDKDGNAVQYFYCIYDFGLGPLSVKELKIGDTPFKDYAELEYNLVDLNRPVTSEGIWDDPLLSDFKLYRGEYESEALAITLDGNADVGGPSSSYQVTRTVPGTPNGDDLEIIVQWIFPQGLYGLQSDGTKVYRNVGLLIEFAEVGTEEWSGFNSYAQVSNARSVGGSFAYSDTVEGVFSTHSEYIRGTGSGSHITPVYMSVLSYETKPYSYARGRIDIVYTMIPDIGTVRLYKMGYAAGATKVYSLQQVESGRISLLDGENFASILSSVYIGDYYDGEEYLPIYEHTLSSPLPRDVVLREVLEVYRDVGGVKAYEYVLASYEPIRYGTNGDGRVLMTAKVQKPVYGYVSFTPKVSGDYKVRITRTNSYGDATYQNFDTMTITELAARINRAPILTDKRHVFLELKVKATNQINGAIQNLSGVCTSVLDTYDINTQTWTKQLTKNPAWIYVDLLIGQINKRPLAKTQLDVTSIADWADFCDEVPTSPTGITYTLPRYECNFILDFNTTLQDIINKVTNSCQAGLLLVDGKYGVLIDKRKTIPVQMFTPRNSYGFSSSRSFEDIPDGLKVKYIDHANWEVVEKIVYTDGFDELTAEDFDDVETFGCTNEEQAWRYGRYLLAQHTLRKETINITVDFENLVCTRGDYVLVTQDVMRVGGVPARVMAVVGDVITTDDGIDYDSLLSYGYTFRSIAGIKTSTLTVNSATEFKLDGDIPSVGDLIVIGEVSKITYDCIVKSIEALDELSANLVLVERADAINDAESTDTFPPYDPQINADNQSLSSIPPEVENLAVTENTWRCNGSGYEYYITVDWDIPFGAIYETFEVYVDRGYGYALVGYVNETEYSYIVRTEDLGVEHSIVVIGVSATGKKKNMASVTGVTATPVSKSTPPSDIISFDLNITGEVLQFDWIRPSDCDIDQYLIRYSPQLSATWETSIPLLRLDRNVSMATTQARTGSYYIKAIDWNGNESQNALMGITSIPELFNLNLIDITNDFPTLPGTLDRVVTDGASIMLTQTGVNQYESEGYYYFANFLDLGDIYTVRLQSLIEVEGYTESDMMGNWDTLADVAALSNSGASQWEVEAQYRSTDSFITMSSWTTLSDVNPLSSGVSDIWTSWRKFTLGDFTGRVFQFRLRLVSNVPSVTPRVFDGVIRADMPDRIESAGNLTTPVSGGLVVSYDYAFTGPTPSPVIQITQDNASNGDYFKITDKTLEGFTITFYDIGDNEVSRTFDYMAKGWGRRNTVVL